ncbi:lysophospholipid acyltransferase family protein [Undibacterium sp. TS12]|uniref:lysophospholipid acyltransferase family protein n=1 Tax=Undibacterium sp. TS12 TaxID=2908202 RepID=UPI001F4CF52D|nr:lysophospholipid acyltransferase family protein [Undibacterium sp. TS12]MCH8620681.1 1-acyl-sn-glycerol-3-phosphate acyltransferase [Undibacterium sp. TS12]
MLEGMNRYWRVFATGLSFATFGLGGVLLWALVFPVLNLLVLQQERRTEWARVIIRRSFRGFVGLMKGLGVLRYELIGLERLERGGLLILANHPTLIDTVFLMAFVKRADCIVKSHLWNNPFTRGPVRAASYISNAQGTELLDACITSLRAGNNLIVFPEGTRTPANGAITLKRGAANIAVRGACAVTPVVISCVPPTLGKGDKWWRVPERFVQFRIEVKEDIPFQQFVAAGRSEVMAARDLTDYLQQYFTKENQHHA